MKKKDVYRVFNGPALTGCRDDAPYCKRWEDISNSAIIIGPCKRMDGVKYDLTDHAAYVYSYPLAKRIVKLLNADIKKKRLERDEVKKIL